MTSCSDFTHNASCHVDRWPCLRAAAGSDLRESMKGTERGHLCEVRKNCNEQKLVWVPTESFRNHCTEDSDVFQWKIHFFSLDCILLLDTLTCALLQFPLLLFIWSPLTALPHPSVLSAPDLHPISSDLPVCPWSVQWQRHNYLLSLYLCPTIDFLANSETVLYCKQGHIVTFSEDKLLVLLLQSINFFHTHPPQHHYSSSLCNVIQSGSNTASADFALGESSTLQILQCRLHPTNSTFFFYF